MKKKGTVKFSCNLFECRSSCSVHHSQVRNYFSNTWDSYGSRLYFSWWFIYKSEQNDYLWLQMQYKLWNFTHNQSYKTSAYILFTTFLPYTLLSKHNMISLYVVFAPKSLQSHLGTKDIFSRGKHNEVIRFEINRHHCRLERMHIN